MRSFTHGAALLGALAVSGCNNAPEAPNAPEKTGVEKTITDTQAGQAKEMRETVTTSAAQIAFDKALKDKNASEVLLVPTLHNTPANKLVNASNKARVMDLAYGELSLASAQTEKEMLETGDQHYHNAARLFQLAGAKAALEQLDNNLFDNGPKNPVLSGNRRSLLERIGGEELERERLQEDR